MSRARSLLFIHGYSLYLIPTYLILTYLHTSDLHTSIPHTSIPPTSKPRNSCGRLAKPLFRGRARARARAPKCRNRYIQPPNAGISTYGLPKSAVLSHFSEAGKRQDVRHLKICFSDWSNVSAPGALRLPNLSNVLRPGATYLPNVLY